MLPRKESVMLCKQVGEELPMTRWFRYFVSAAGILLIVAQFFRPARTNPTVDPKREIGTSVSIDPIVGSVLARSCNDCHSNRTTWPWYSHVAPVSWLVVTDVNRGRKALNFSEWSSYRAKAQQEHLSEICKEVTEGEMPEFSYTLTHRDARLDKADKSAICHWTQSSAQGLSAADAE
jgi:hypothetical protein